jgi:hypothetical protein
MKFKDWNDGSWNDYMEEMIKNNGDVFGECYNTHSDYGQWGGKSTGKDKAYQKWYNEKVRNYEGGEYKGPKKGKNRTKNNRRDDMWRKFDPEKKVLKKYLKKYVIENQDKVPKKLLDMYGLGDKPKSVEKKRRGQRGRGLSDRTPQTQSPSSSKPSSSKPSSSSPSSSSPSSSKPSSSSPSRRRRTRNFDKNQT